MAENTLVGAMNQITASVIIGAAALIRKGQVYQLAHPLEQAMPQLADLPEMSAAARLSIKVRAHDVPQFETRIFSELVTLLAHSGTHIDAFSHWSKNGKMYGNVDPKSIYSEDGMKQLGLDTMPPIITRGVLIDAAAYNGVDTLPGGKVLQPEDLQAMLDRQRMSLQSGDVAIVRTGWTKHWVNPRTYMSQAPGLSRRSAHWIADQKCVAIGIDQWVADAVPPERDEDRRACHEVCLTERGMHIIENLNLEEMARDKVYQFLFIALAPPLKGATGFPVQALGIV
jgi:kynurenine formamidase